VKPGPSATYRCTVCGVTWSYEAVRHLACCRDCGSGLLRTVPALGLGAAADDAAAGRRQRRRDASGERGTRSAAAPIRARLRSR
jgi:predicted  nucleic acid-binding Zn-ribbon protein